MFLCGTSMRFHVFVVAFFSWFPLAYSNFDSAKELMEKSDCLACHQVETKLVGPSLKEIATRYKGSDIASLVNSVVKGSSGKWGAVPMPQHPNLTESEVKQMVEGILSLVGEPPKNDGKTEEPVVSTPKTSASDIQKGADLFQGTNRFINPGPACNSCHHVKNDAIIGGGVLAKDLTEVFTRLGQPGIHTVLNNLPFPVMEQAYKDKPLTEEEITAIVSFLQHADEQKFYQSPRDYGWGLFFAGLSGAAVLMLFFFFVGLRRKKQPVAHDIFKRQVKSR